MNDSNDDFDVVKHIYEGIWGSENHKKLNDIGIELYKVHKYANKYDVDNDIIALSIIHPISVILIDLDDFKSINDIYGHQTGDHVLQQAAIACKKEARQSDIVSRWGGEEFLLTLPETDVAGAECLAERILNQLHDIHLSLSQLGKRQITASIGVSAWQNDSDSFEAMVYRADQAMYSAKTSGKDKVIRD